MSTQPTILAADDERELADRCATWSRTNTHWTSWRTEAYRRLEADLKDLSDSLVGDTS